MLVVVFVGTMIIATRRRWRCQRCPPASQQGPPALVSAHITQIGRPCHKGAAAAMMRIAKLPRKVEQAPLYEIESAWNEEKRVP